MALWRCNSLKCEGNLFEAERPKCPKCGLDAESHPRFAQYITPLTIIHFDPPLAPGLIAGVGKNVTLCDGTPVGQLVRRKEQATGDPTCVSCQRCRDHPEFPNLKDWDQAQVQPAWTVGNQIRDI